MRAAAVWTYYFVFGVLALPLLFAYSRLTRKGWRKTRLAHWALGWDKSMMHSPSAQILGSCWCQRNDTPLTPTFAEPLEIVATLSPPEWARFRREFFPEPTEQKEPTE